MIGQRIGATGAQRRLLPIAGFHVPTAAVVAIMTFAMIVVGAAGLALANAAASIAQGVENRVVVQLPSAVAGELPRALQAARSAPGVVQATPVPEAEMRETLARWMGEAAAATDLPVPALITIEMSPQAAIAPLRRQVEAAVPGATVTAEGAELEPLVGSLRGLQWLALSLVVLIVGATGAAVVLAARGAFDTHRPTIEIMHGIGATDIQLTRLFQRKLALDAGAGALAGTGAAAIALLLVGGGGFGFAGGLIGGSPLGPRDIVVLLCLPLAAVVLATVVARWTILKALREAL